jgi:hypothetical protein
MPEGLLDVAGRSAGPQHAGYCRHVPGQVGTDDLRFDVVILAAAIGIGEGHEPATEGPATDGDGGRDRTIQRDRADLSRLMSHRSGRDRIKIVLDCRITGGASGRHAARPPGMSGPGAAEKRGCTSKRTRNEATHRDLPHHFRLQLVHGQRWHLNKRRGFSVNRRRQRSHARACSTAAACSRRRHTGVVKTSSISYHEVVASYPGLIPGREVDRKEPEPRPAVAAASESSHFFTLCVARTASCFVKEAVEPGSTIHTDGWEGYGGLMKAGYRHRVTAQREPASRACCRGCTAWWGCSSGGCWGPIRAASARNIWTTTSTSSPSGSIGVGPATAASCFTAWHSRRSR